MNETIYQHIIHEVFQNGLIEFVSNYDDVHFGWSIAPRVGVVIRFMVNCKDHYRVRIVRDGYTLYKGVVPLTDEGNINQDFLKVFLRNYNNIG